MTKIEVQAKTVFACVACVTGVNVLVLASALTSSLYMPQYNNGLVNIQKNSFLKEYQLMKCFQTGRN